MNIEDVRKRKEIQQEMRYCSAESIDQMVEDIAFLLRTLDAIAAEAQPERIGLGHGRQTKQINRIHTLAMRGKE